MTIRSDNADERLTEKGKSGHPLLNPSLTLKVGRQVSAVSDRRWSAFCSQRSDIKETRRLLEQFIHTPQVCARGRLSLFLTSHIQGWATLGINVRLDGIRRR